MNSYLVNIQLSQGTAATDLRRGGMIYSSILYSLSQMQRIIKISLYLLQCYHKNISGTVIYGARCMLC